MLLVNRLQLCSDECYPVDSFIMRILVKDFLDRQEKGLFKFKNNSPGPNFVVSVVPEYKTFKSCSFHPKATVRCSVFQINEDFLDQILGLGDMRMCLHIKIFILSEDVSQKTQ